MDTSKNQMAINFVAAEIAKLPANSPMEHGTIGAGDGLTQRQGRAKGMAIQIVETIRRQPFPAALYEDWTAAERADYENVQIIADAAVAQIGK